MDRIITIIMRGEPSDVARETARLVAVLNRARTAQYFISGRDDAYWPLIEKQDLLFRGMRVRLSVEQSRAMEMLVEAYGEPVHQLKMWRAFVPDGDEEQIASAMNHYPIRLQVLISKIRGKLNRSPMALRIDRPDKDSYKLVIVD